MHQGKKIILCFIIGITVLSYQASYGQKLGDEPPKFELKAWFVKQFLEIEANQSFFNILKIYNPTAYNQSFELALNTPMGWSLMIENNQRFSVPKGDTLIIPVRAAISKQVKGEIGYSLVAALRDQQGNSITNTSFFVKVPKKTELRFRNLSRMEYFDQKTQSATFRIKLENRGNIDELIDLEFELPPSLKMTNAINNIYTDKITLPPHVDSTYQYRITRDESDIYANKPMHRLDIKITSPDTSFQSTVWFKDLDYKYKNTIPSEKKMLIARLMAHNLFSDNPTNITSSLYGTILLKNQQDIYYRFDNYKSSSFNDLWLYSKMYAGYRNPTIDIKIGDVTKSIEQNMLGRGVDATVSLDKHEIRAAGSWHILRPVTNYGGEYTFKVNNNLFLGTGGSYKHQENLAVESKVGYVESRFNIANTNSISMRFAASEEVHSLTENFTKQGLGINLNYSGTIKDNVRFSVSNRYGSPNYSGSYRGRLYSRADMYYKIDQINYINFDYHLQEYRPKYYFNGQSSREQQYTYQQGRAIYHRIINPTVTLNAGPIYQRQNSNSFTHFQEGDWFGTESYKIKVGGRLKEQNLINTFNPSVTLAMNRFTDYSKNFGGQYNPDIQSKPPFFSGKFRFNMQRKYWGAYLTYFYGPYSLNQMFNYFYGGNFHKSVRLMPYFKKFIYKDIVELVSRGAYMRNLAKSTDNFTLSNRLTSYLPNGLELSLLNNFNYSSVYDEVTERKYKYSSIYFEMALRKEFGFNQPRMKFHDLKLLFYKDINGNRVKDENEPGINKVLVNFSRDQQLNKNKDYEGEFYSTELLSNHDGIVMYEKIPDGYYQVKFNSLGTNGNFYSSNNKRLVHVTANTTLEIPFLENNKIFGKVILNRSKLSNLGDIDLSNIKVKAVDSEGNITSTLTDHKGEFVLYLPNVDVYDVSINNIFYEHFDLRQNHFDVQLNGYKQFEMSFVFDEKRRKINFSPSFEPEDFKIKTVRRTNLSGTVKDESTLSPLYAKVEVIDNKSGETIVSTHTNRGTGKYSTSFITGDNYTLVVNSDDYWYHSENLYLNQLTTFQDIEKNILLKSIIIGSKLKINNLQFEEGSTQIPPAAYPELERLVNQLKKNQNIRIQVAGHCDDLEAMEERNISEERAKAVTKFLIENGFSNIEYVGYQNAQPVTSNDTEESRAQNRRVEVIVTDK